MAEPYGLPAGTAINYVSLGFPAWVDMLCARWGLDSSTYPGHQEGDRPDIGSAPNPDHLNRGIDWAGPPDRMLAFARWLVSIGPPRFPGQYGPPGLEMVIYRHVPTGEDVTYPAWVDFSGDLPGHTDHVHTRQSAALIDLAAVMTVPLEPRPGGRWGSPSPAWDHLIERESGGDFTIIQQIIDVNSGGNEAEGLFQITPATWRAHDGEEFAPTPRAATPQQQALVAARIFLSNPSGSDWGAGLPGREDPAELAAGLVPVGPTEEDDMFTDDDRAMLQRVHACLFNPIDSQSAYREPGEAPGRWQLHELIKNDDGMIHQLYVERMARDGDPDAIDLLQRVAKMDPALGRQEDAARAARFLDSLTTRVSTNTAIPATAIPATATPPFPSWFAPTPEPATPAAEAVAVADPAVQPDTPAAGGLAEHLAHAAAAAAAAALAEAQPHLEQAEVDAVRARIKEVLG